MVGGDPATWGPSGDNTNGEDNNDNASSQGYFTGDDGNASNTSFDNIPTEDTTETIVPAVDVDVDQV